MILFRLLILIAIVLCLLWLVKRLFSPQAEPEKLDRSKSEKMLQCKHCGVHAPESSIITRNNVTYCCPEHADLDQR